MEEYKEYITEEFINCGMYTRKYMFPNGFGAVCMETVSNVTDVVGINADDETIKQKEMHNWNVCISKKIDYDPEQGIDCIFIDEKRNISFEEMKSVIEEVKNMKKEDQ